VPFQEGTEVRGKRIAPALNVGLLVLIPMQTAICQCWPFLLLRNQFVDNFAGNIGQPKIAALEAVS
jgi:hypothetical protein